MVLIRVNTGQEQPNPNTKAVGNTGIYKQPKPHSVRITNQGLEGDAISNLQVHGGVDQAVYVYSQEDYDWWSRELRREIAPGTFGENLTISGVDSDAWAVGDRLHIGEVVLEVTSPRVPCYTLAARMEDMQFIPRFCAAQRPGFYCRVIAPGSVQAGDEVTVERTTRETVTILEMFRAYYETQPSLDFLRRCLQASINERWRARMEEKYRQWFNIESDPDPKDIQTLEERIIEFNFAATGFYDGEQLGIFLRDENGEIFAGISGFTWGGTGKVEWLWVREDWRGKGLGRDLLVRAEEEALRRGCGMMVVDTHSFQAPDFYEKQGYIVVGKQDDFPRGHQSIFLQKRLTQ